MSTTIDNRAVQLGFDNRQFETGAKTSIDSLNALKRGLDLTESAKSLTRLADAGKGFNIGPIADGVQNISTKFSALGVIGFTILQNLTNAAIDMGRKMWTSITAPAKLGFSEYETQMNAIQTIMANTSAKGTTLNQVNAALEELNLYADKTIYNFSEMAKNIGTFTAAGVDLDTSVAAIKGIANLAAVSGSNSQQAATAMYQLSQAISSGTVKLMDWNSVVNAGMGGEVFQNALKETARVHGIAIDDMIASEGSFRNTLQEGWLTSEILTETLSKFTGDLNEQQLLTMGYTEEQIAGIIKMGETANDAATKVKTFTQLKSTLQESLQSGWAKTWQIIIGDFEEAKAFFTNVNDFLGKWIQESSDARNNMLENWKLLGGRTALIASVTNSFDAIVAAVKPVKEAFKEIFPSKMGYFELAKMTYALKNFTASLKMGGETADKVKRIFKGIFAVFDIFRMAVSALWKVFKSLLGTMEGSGSGILEFLARIGDFLVSLRDAIKSGDVFAGTIEKITNFIENMGASFKEFSSKIGLEFGKLQDAVEIFKEKFQEIFSFEKVELKGVDTFFKKVKVRFAPLETIVKITAVLIGGLIKLLQWAAPLLARVIPFFGKLLGGLGTAISEGISDLDFNKVFDIINTGLLATLALAVKNFISKGSGTLDSVSGMFSGITGTLDGVRGSLEAYQKNLQANTLLTIASAVAILVVSLIALSMVDSEKLTKATLAVSAMFAELVASMTLLGKAGAGGLTGGMGLALTLMGMSVALLILTGVLKSIAEMDEGDLKKSLTSLGAMTAGLVLFAQQLSANARSFIGTSISLMLLGAALAIIVGVVERLGNLNVSTIQNGLISLGAILGELAVFMQASNVNNMGASKGVGIIALSAAILIMADSVEKLGNLDVAVLQQGLIAIGAILAGILAFIQLSGNGKGVISTAIGMTILAASMLIFAEAIKDMGNLSWDQIGKGLATMGGALLIIAIAMRLLPKNMVGSSVSLVLVGSAMLILAEALGKMGGMSWKQIAKGLTTLAGALLIISVAMFAMKGALPGAAALLIVSGALAILAPVLQTLGSMSITEIGLSLLTLAGVFVIFGVAGYALTPVVPTLMGLGVAITLLGVAIGLIGAGILAFSIGLSGLAVSGTAGAIALVAIVGTLLGVVPLVVTTIANAIVQFAVLIGNAAPQIGKALEQVLLALISVIANVTPPLCAALGVLLSALFQLIKDSTPEALATLMDLLVELGLFLRKAIPVFVQIGWDLLIGFLKGIRDNIAEVVTVVGEIITEFLDAMALQLPSIIDSGFKLIIAFIDGIATAIDENGADLIAACGRLAEAIITGLTDGILGSVGDVINAVVNLGSGIIDALKTLLGIASPSKVTKKMGKQLDQGLIDGVESGENSVYNAIEDLGEGALSSFAAAIDSINNALNSTLDVYPSITPVVDLSNVLASGEDIASIFGSPSLSLLGSLDKLSSAASNMESGFPSNNQINQPATPSNVTFNQNNYSPKALSSVEIYRNTRNQLLMTKGLVGTS